MLVEEPHSAAESSRGVFESPAGTSTGGSSLSLSLSLFSLLSIVVKSLFICCLGIDPSFAKGPRCQVCQISYPREFRSLRHCSLSSVLVTAAFLNVPSCLLVAQGLLSRLNGLFCAVALFTISLKNPSVPVCLA